MAAEDRPGNRFHSLVRRWFETRIGCPTPIQKKAWLLIASNAHVLIAAPTGSGKTLSAFLWALDQLILERWEGRHTRVLYKSTRWWAVTGNPVHIRHGKALTIHSVYRRMGS